MSKTQLPKTQIVFDLISIFLCIIIAVYAFQQPAIADTADKVILPIEIIETFMVIGAPFSLIYSITVFFIMKKTGLFSPLPYLITILTIALCPVFGFLFVMVMGPGNEYDLASMFFLSHIGRFINIVQRITRFQLVTS